MIKNLLRLIIFFMAISLTAQEIDQQFYETKTDHYLIKSTLSSELSAQTGYILEQLYGIFEDFTGKSTKDLNPLIVYELDSREAFDSLLISRWNKSSHSYLLLRQGNMGYSELIIFREQGVLNIRALNHLALFQYIEACNSHTPFWLKEGLARHFETIILDEPNQGKIPFNWGAFSEYKNRDKMWTLERLFQTQEEELIIFSSQSFPECWSFTQYLLHNNEDRLLWEYLSLIRTGRTDEWPEPDLISMEEDYRKYIDNIDETPTLADDLKALFMKDYYTRALALIKESAEEESWIGLYYTGLIHYERGLYQDSLNEFSLSLERGGPEDRVKYAMGLCQLELGNRNEGITLLKEARELNRDIISDSLIPLLD